MSLEHFKQPEVSREEITTPELVQDRKAAYEQAEAAFRDDNEKHLKKTDKIEDKETRQLALARLGLVSVRMAETNQELMVSLK